MASTYWVGEYERSIELSRRTRALARDVQSAESLLRGGGLEALGLAGLGSHEQAIAIWDEPFEVARELGQNPRVLLNYSALVYRELHDLDEARRRSAQAAWPVRWKGVEQATGWTTWLIAGRLTYARAEIARHAESPESAAEWAARATRRGGGRRVRRSRRSRTRSAATRTRSRRSSKRRTSSNRSHGRCCQSGQHGSSAHPRSRRSSRLRGAPRLRAGELEVATNSRRSVADDTGSAEVTQGPLSGSSAPVEDCGVSPEVRQLFVPGLEADLRPARVSGGHDDVVDLDPLDPVAARRLDVGADDLNEDRSLSRRRRARVRLDGSDRRGGDTADGRKQG